MEVAMSLAFHECFCQTIYPNCGVYYICNIDTHYCIHVSYICAYIYIYIHIIAIMYIYIYMLLLCTYVYLQFIVC